MRKGGILGYDLNEKNCQISYYDETKEEPETMGAAADNFQIPLILGYYRERWVFGLEAKRLASVQEGTMVSDLFEKAVRREKVKIGSKKRDAVWLLAKFIRMTLEGFEDIAFITFSVPFTNIDMSKMLKGIGQRLGVAKECVCVQDYKESFCQYMFYQPKELWQYESALFYCDAQEIRAYMLRRLNAVGVKDRDMFVTVEEVASAQMNELAAIYTLLNKEKEKVKDKAKAADDRFKRFIQSVFEKKVVSSVYLTGEGFENNWYPNSLKVLCNGRRAFIGNNLYSKGACYTSMRRYLEYHEGPVYLDDTKMTEQICLRMRVNGQEGWYPIVSWGTHWYEADGQWEVILEDTSDIEIHVESLAGKNFRWRQYLWRGFPTGGIILCGFRLKCCLWTNAPAGLCLRTWGLASFFHPQDFKWGRPFI